MAGRRGEFIPSLEEGLDELDPDYLNDVMRLAGCKNKCRYFPDCHCYDMALNEEIGHYLPIELDEEDDV